MQTNPPLDLKPYFLTLTDLVSPIDWREFFGNTNPVEIDVGSGRGLFLVTAGQKSADVNFLGIEIDYREGRRAAKRLKKREMPNVRVLGGDVQTAFSRHVPSGSVHAIHVHFPDPWWKRKHRRRRVFTDAFVDQMATVLEPGGWVHSRTDVEEYFGVISQLMDRDARFESHPPPKLNEPQHDMDYRTSFERKKRRDGCEIYCGLWRLRQTDEGELRSSSSPMAPLA